MIKKKSMIWFAAVIAVSLGIGVYINSYMHKYSGLVTVYVAKENLPFDQPIHASSLIKDEKPKAAVPDDAITDPNQVDGLYASTTILRGQIVQKAAISNAKTLREVVRKYGMNFGALTVPVDQNDFPLSSVNTGDTVSIIGVFTQANGTTRTPKSRYVAENVPVLNVLSDTRSGLPKLVVAVTRDDALNVALDLATGKIRVMLDPRPFSSGTPDGKTEKVGSSASPDAQRAPSPAGIGSDK